ncbi:XdhC family protein [Amylibacter sp. SFDW26]|uniref:XdhC family protein n=1 Tax=Amylibacter sp. SFDW26 TaxID=2652722 RepID=UPI00126168B7|nr:XdhC family protein [Amylibacter sp. SFDW26]KAB7615984.1 XdhC family protein [Amylibacter sp. SFDW26]
MTISNHMPTVVQSYIAAGQGAALATVISTWGSAPRRVGSQLAIAADGTFQGSVSGGCVEAAVILEAQAAIEDGKCRVLEYGVADEDAFAVGLACGGDIKILVEPIGVGDGPDINLINQIVAAYKSRKSLSINVNLSNWAREVFDCSKPTGIDGGHFMHAYVPNLRMIIIGAVHITQSLSLMAKMAEYDVYLVDPRDSFASPERFPDETFIDAWPDKALTQIGLDEQCAVITLSHDPKIDTPALAVALRSDAFYIGSLGSNKTHAKRVRQLENEGFTMDDIIRIHGPIGLDIGSKTPAEIAISIMAEVTERFRKPETRP